MILKGGIKATLNLSIVDNDFYIFAKDENNINVGFCHFGITYEFERKMGKAFRENYAKHNNIPIEQAPKTMLTRVSDQEHFDIKDDKIILSNGDIYNIKEIICHLYRIEILDERFFKVGLGSCLLKALESVAVKNNCSQIEAFFSPFGDFSHGALIFYKNNGFEFYKHPRFNTDYIRKYLVNSKSNNLK